MITSNRTPVYVKKQFNTAQPSNKDKSKEHVRSWGMRQNHAGRRNNNRLDDPNSLLISVGHKAESCRP